MFEIDLENEIKVTFDSELQLYLVESAEHLNGAPIRVPAEVVEISDKDGHGPESLAVSYSCHCTSFMFSLRN